jgi:gliding motility-associated-like protein
MEDISGLGGGTYSVIITDANGCSVTGDWSLLDPAAVNLLSTIQPILCYGINNAGISIEIMGGTPAYNILWNTGANTTTLSNLGPGNYSVTVTDSRGCSNSSSYTLTPPPPVTVSLNSPYTIWLGDNVDLEAFPSGGTGAYTYSWNPPTDLSCTDCPISEAAPKLNTTYAVIVTDQNGCTATADAYIEVLYALYVPNTFTPNGDNDNDEFLAVSVSVKEFSMRVFDRWGEEIFSTININEGWDGNYKGIESKQDVYVYRIEAKFLNGKSQELVGQVNLLR